MALVDVGKTFLLRQIAAQFAAAGKKVCATATTGIAAINLSVPEYRVAGSTLHSWAGVGLGDSHPQKLAARVMHDERARKRWMTTDILIIDEVSMLGAAFFDKLDFIGRDIRKSPDIPFGGLQIIFSGDFLQLPPVNDKFTFESFAWKEIENLGLKTFVLEEPKRYEDIEWFYMLLRIREAKPTTEDIKFLRTRVKAYQDYLKSLESNETLVVKPTILFSKKVDVEYENNRELDELPGMFKDFKAEDIFTAFNSHARPEHYMKPLDDAIPVYIRLKIGAQVMLKANLDIQGGLANGTQRSSH